LRARLSANKLPIHMREAPYFRRCALLGALVFAAFAAGLADSAGAQEYVSQTQTGPSLDAYLKQVGPDGQVIAHGQLKLDGKALNCGKRPTVLNPNFDSWGGAFPGFLILNPKKMNGLSTQVKLYIYSHECGHQFVGADETKADLFAIRRGVKWGWLDAQGMEDICVFISQLKGDSVHPPGSKRCETMRHYYRKLIEGAPQQAVAPQRTPKAQTLGPAQ
jgi:hypothetical protein